MSGLSAKVSISLLEYFVSVFDVREDLPHDLSKVAGFVQVFELL
jgi:hypothetical protein